jgi:hypothetical protein
MKRKRRNDAVDRDKVRHELDLLEAMIETARLAVGTDSIPTLWPIQDQVIKIRDSLYPEYKPER